MRKRIKKIIACAAMAGLLSIFVLGCTCICARQVSTDGRLVILQEPQSQTVLTNSPVNFSVVAMHVGPPATNAIAYQWRFNGLTITGATSSTYLITNVQFSNVGAYDVVVTGSTLVSQTAYLGVFSSTGNGGTLCQPIGKFGSGGSGTCISGTWVYYSFPLYSPPTGTTKVSIDTFSTLNGSYDTAVRVVQRSPLTNLCCNDDSPIAPTSSPKQSQCTNVTTRAASSYQFLIYVNENPPNPIPPSGTQFYLNYQFY